MNKAKRLAILTRLRENDPHPTTELHFSSPFELLIAVLLSAQATDVSVNKATAKLYPVANTPAAMLALGVDGVKSYIKTIGLFNSKAENVIKTCRILLEQHNGEVPEDRAALEALPGVGRKTANVVLIPPLAGRPSPWTRTSSASAIGRSSPRARMLNRWKRSF
ncbi:endonuclease III [Klebsiella pneumoniae]|nr:endonuclease III [Klebsiella pneumoniae]